MGGGGGNQKLTNINIVAFFLRKASLTLIILSYGRNLPKNANLKMGSLICLYDMKNSYSLETIRWTFPIWIRPLGIKGWAGLGH